MLAPTPAQVRLRAVPHGRHRPKPQETGQTPRPARGQTRLKDEKGRPDPKNDGQKINPAKTGPPKPTTFSTASLVFGTGSGLYGIHMKLLKNSREAATAQ